MKNGTRLTIGALIGVSVLAMTLGTASARIVCNADGDCWHVRADYDYRPEFRLSIHPDDWKWREGERYQWREHEGRGYWSGGNWREF